jgi:hypothetical protein
VAASAASGLRTTPEAEDAAVTLLREAVECWLARLHSIQPAPTREELLAPHVAGVSVQASAGSTDRHGGRGQEEGGPDASESRAGRRHQTGLDGLFAGCPAAEEDIDLLARSVIALKEVASCARSGGPEVAELRSIHEPLLPLSVQLVSAQFYVTVGRIRNVHGTVLPVGEAFDTASALARSMSEDVLGRSDAVEAIREGASFDEGRMLLAPGQSLRGSGRVAPRTFGVRAGGSAAQPRKAIVVLEDLGT